MSRRGPSLRDGVPSAPTPLVVSGDAALADFAAALRRHCIRDRELCLKVLAYDSGVALGRLRDFLRSDPVKRRAPSLAEALSVWAAIAAADPDGGAAVATRSLARAGLRAETDDTRPAELAGLVADIAGDLTEVARAQAAGGITAANADEFAGVARRLKRDGKAIDRLAREARRP